MPSLSRHPRTLPRLAGQRSLAMASGAMDVLEARGGKPDQLMR